MVVAELQTKVEKYETRASRCESRPGGNRQGPADLLRGAGRLLQQPGDGFSEDHREANGRIGGQLPLVHTEIPAHAPRTIAGRGLSRAASALNNL